MKIEVFTGLTLAIWGSRASGSEGPRYPWIKLGGRAKRSEADLPYSIGTRPESVSNLQLSAMELGRLWQSNLICDPSCVARELV